MSESSSQQAPRRATSRDVAAEAGVSRSTVSFVLNGVTTQSISPETERAVRAAAARLGYTPSATARALRIGRSQVIVSLAPASAPSLVMGDAMALIGSALEREGYASVVATADPDQLASSTLWASVQPAAVIAMFDLPAAARARLASMRVPVIEMHLSSRLNHSHALDTDPLSGVQLEIGRRQAEHLLDRGCRRLVYAVTDSASRDILADRLEGVRSFARRAGLPEVRVVDSFQRQEGDAARLGLSNAVGVCAYNDLTALRVLAAARGVGLEAPRDFRIVGVDDDPTSALVIPALSTVRLELAELTGVVLSRVRAALGLAGQASNSGERPFTTLIARDSS